MFKSLIENKFKEQSFCRRIFGSQKKKIGMCGDGANDLMAIK